MQALILTAGEGKRFGNLTAQSNKCLLEINGKALIEHHIENIIQTGLFDEIIIVVGYMAEKVIERIERNKYDISISFCRQDMTRKGIICSIESAAGLIHDDFLLLLGDEFIIENKYYEAVKLFREVNCSDSACPGLLAGEEGQNFCECMVGICEENDEDKIKKNYTFRMEDGVMSSFIEKPEAVLSPFIGTGNILFSAEVMNMLALVPENAVRKERELVGLLNLIAEGKGKILPFMAGRKYFNINDIGEYEKAKEEYRKS